jgi:hypothetical protein
LLEQNEESPVERVRDMTPETIAPSGAISPSSFRYRQLNNPAHVGDVQNKPHTCH